MHHRALQVLTLLTRRAELDRVAARVGSESEHRCQQRRDLRGIEARRHEPGIELVEASRRRIVGLPAERLCGHLREGGEGRVLSVRRAAAFEPDMILAGQPLTELVDEARLADPGLASDVHDLPAAATCARPGRVEHGELVPAADEPRSAAVRRLRRAILLGTDDPQELERLGDAFDVRVPQRVDREHALDESQRGARDRDASGLGEALATRRDVHDVAQGERIATMTAAHLLHHDLAGMDPDPHRQALRDLIVELRNVLQQGQAGVHRHLGRALVRLRVPEVHDQPVAEVLRDVTAELLDGPLTRCLVAPHQPAEVLRVEARGERHGIDEVAEQDGDLPPLTLGDGRRCDRLDGCAGAADCCATSVAEAGIAPVLAPARTTLHRFPPRSAVPPLDSTTREVPGQRHGPLDPGLRAAGGRGCCARRPLRAHFVPCMHSFGSMTPRLLTILK